MMHSGFEPSGALSSSPRDSWINFKYNFGSRPAPYPSSPELTRAAFNGASIGKGHLAEAKEAVNREFAGVKSAFARGGNDLPHDHGGSGGSGACSSGPSGAAGDQLADLKAKIAAAKKIEVNSQ
jgi:hypothetical protein